MGRPGLDGPPNFRIIGRVPRVFPLSP
jgi:hypothetical protein